MTIWYSESFILIHCFHCR
jgi:hypothetical protein